MKKKSILLGLMMGAAVMALPSVAQAGTNQGLEQMGEGALTVYRRTNGELTGDGKISVRDVLQAMKTLEAGEQADDDQAKKADVNYDGQLNKEDTDLLFQAAFDGNCTNMGYEEPADEHVLIVDPGAYPCGDYCYSSLQEASDVAKERNPQTEADRVTILIAPGVLREHVEVETPYLTFRAMEPDKETKITFYYGAGRYYKSYRYEDIGSHAATVYLTADAHDFRGEYITFENSFNIYKTPEELEDERVMEKDEETIMKHREDPTEGQSPARAMFCATDRAVFDHCKFYGRQDTLQIEYYRAYFNECYIEGTVDYIFGSSAVVFEKCQLNCPYNSGHLTAASTDLTEKYGYLFKDCTITRNAVEGASKGAPDDGSYTLGRSWGKNRTDDVDRAMVVYWNCKMDSHIKTGYNRFAKMVVAPEEARFGEVGTMDLDGNPLDLSKQCPEYETIYSQEDLAPTGEYAQWKWLYGDDGWNPAGLEIPEGATL